MALKFYCYQNCSTCRKAKKFLLSRGISFEEIPIRESPPSKSEIKRMVTKLTLNRLYNSSSQTYRDLGMKEKRKTISVKDQIDILSKNGNLIKRPFAIGSAHGKEVMLTGFKEAEWKQLFP